MYAFTYYELRSRWFFSLDFVRRLVSTSFSAKRWAIDTMLVEELARIPPAQRVVVQQALDSNCDSLVNRLESSNNFSSNDKFNANNQFDAKDFAKIVSKFESNDKNFGEQENLVDLNDKSDSRLVINI